MKLLNIIVTIIMMFIAVDLIADDIEFTPGDAYSWIMDDNDGDPVFTTEVEDAYYGWGYIGTSHDNQIYKIYSEYIYADGVQLTSDERKKENIKDISGAVEKIKKLRSVKFDFKIDKPSFEKLTEKKQKSVLKSKKNRLGFLAQNMLDVYPELVEHEEKSDVYSINYSGMIPVLVQALKEQQAQIEELKKQMESK
jgi:flagellar biosynthesis chaperone FliJ